MRLLAAVADGAIALERLAGRVEGLLVRGTDEVFVRESLQQRSASAGVDLVGESQRPRELRGGLAVRSRGGGSLGRDRCELEHRGTISGRLGVMRQASRVHAELTQRRERRAMEHEQPVRSDRFLDRRARQLMSKRDAGAGRLQDPGREALAERREQLGADHRFQQRHLGLARHHRDGVE